MESSHCCMFVSDWLGVAPTCKYIKPNCCYGDHTSPPVSSKYLLIPSVRFVSFSLFNTKSCFYLRLLLHSPLLFNPRFLSFTLSIFVYLRSIFLFILCICKSNVSLRAMTRFTTILSLFNSLHVLSTSLSLLPKLIDAHSGKV